MAQRIVTIYTDDLTGEETEDAQTHTFALNGVVYEIDLSSDNYDKLSEALGPFIQAGRKLPRGKVSATGSKRSSRAAQSGPDTAKIREWAKEQGYEVNERGRVPKHIREAYEKAQ